MGNEKIDWNGGQGQEEREELHRHLERRSAIGGERGMWAHDRRAGVWGAGVPRTAPRKACEPRFVASRGRCPSRQLDLHK